MFACARVVWRLEHTVYTRAVEYLTGFTGRPCAIALDLWGWLAGWKDRKRKQQDYLSLSTTLAVHGLSGLVGDAAGG
jgi:hypothetical protein